MGTGQNDPRGRRGELDHLLADLEGWAEVERDDDELQRGRRTAGTVTDVTHANGPEPVRGQDLDEQEGWVPGTAMPDEDEQAIRDASPATGRHVNLDDVDVLYARSAAHGMADSAGKGVAVEAAAMDAAQRRGTASGQVVPGPTPGERARAAQRWEQNREYDDARRRDDPSIGGVT